MDPSLNEGDTDMNTDILALSTDDLELVAGGNSSQKFTSPGTAAR